MAVQAVSLREPAYTEYNRKETVTEPVNTSEHKLDSVQKELSAPVTELKRTPDEFAKTSEKSNDNPAGLYSVPKGEEAQKEEPLETLKEVEEQEAKDKKAEQNEQRQAEAEKAEKQQTEKKGMELTASTAHVDREIQHLKDELKQLQRLEQFSEDEDAERLKGRIADLEAELRSKDTDAYRQRHASYSLEPAEE